MTTNQQLWGIHNDALFNKLIEEGFIPIGWEKIGDLSFIGNDQVKMREAIKAAFPAEKPGHSHYWQAYFDDFLLKCRSAILCFAAARPIFNSSDPEPLVGSYILVSFRPHI